jgi:hypothetical protein
MGMDNLPEPDADTTAEICIEIEGVNTNAHAGWPAAFAAFKAAVRAELNKLEAAAPGKKTRTSGAFKKKRSP